MKLIKITFAFVLLINLNLFSQSSEEPVTESDQEISYYSGSENKGLKEIIIEIHRDKTIEIGDRITFQLDTDYTINGIDYPVGTDVYAYTSLDKRGRVLLDIQNIKGNPVKIAKVEDYNDHLEGLYFTNPKGRKKKNDNSYHFLNGYKVILKIQED